MTLTDDDRWLLRYLAEHCTSPDQSGAITIDRDWQQPGEARAHHSKAIATTLSLTYDQLEAIVSRLRQFGLLDRQRTSTSLDIWITAQGQDVAWEPVSDPQTRLTYSEAKGAGMDVLISWSKHQSQEIATVFHRWIPRVLPGVTPWMSDLDIDKGTDWWDELKGLLTRAKMCIICVTKENVRSPWLYFETGAIAGKGEGVRVCPYLLGIGPKMLSDGPLGKYQCTTATKEQTLSLIRSLNKALDETKRHDEGLLEGNFQTRWPEFEAELQRVLAMDADDEDKFVETDADEIAGCNLSSEARTLLVEASRDVSGAVQLIRSDAGVFVFTNGHTFGDEGGPKSQALWRGAFDDLVRHGLIEASDRNGVMFRITANGFRVIEALTGSNEKSTAPRFSTFLDGLSGDELYRLAKAVLGGSQTISCGRNDATAASLVSKSLLEKAPFNPTFQNMELPHTIPNDAWEYLNGNRDWLIQRTIKKNQDRPDRLKQLGHLE